MTHGPAPSPRPVSDQSSALSVSRTKSSRVAAKAAAEASTAAAAPSRVRSAKPRKSPAAQKTAVRKSTAKKPAVRKSTAKQTAQSTATQTPAAKKPAAKKPAAKKPAAKKPAAKKETAKKSAAVRKPASKAQQSAKPELAKQQQAKQQQATTRTRKPESRLALVRRARKINKILAETYPDAHCELDFSSPFQLLVATILSAQTTDKRVNMVTPTLFAKYPTAAELAEADPEDVETIIASTGFFRAKTKSIIGMAKAVCESYGGEIPGKLKDLVTLPGVGRKTANVVLGNAFGVPGITVDTHFQRLSRRFGWTAQKDPVKIEAEVGTLIPKSEWTMLSHRLIWHGRRRCHSRRPACGACPVAPLCPSYGEGPTDPKQAAKLVRSAAEAANQP